jgi:hypothetical protein
MPINSEHLTQLAASKFTDGINTTAGEQWAFDATSSDGTSGLLMGVYHDPTYAFLGPGNLRLSLDLVWSNGSTWSLVDYLAQADIETCADGTRGVWSKPSASYTFSMAADNSVVLLEFDTPRVQGTVSIHSSTPARLADGTVVSTSHGATTDSTWNAPNLHWAEPIPAGRASVDLTIDGSPLKWDGMGGAERWWAGQGWLDALQGWRAVRAVAGPFILTYWAPKSRVSPGVLYPSAFLARSGRKVLSATRGGPSTDREPYVEYRAFDGNGTLMSHTGGDPRKAAHGYVISLVSPAMGRRWEFTLRHEHMEFEFDLGSGSGGVAYVGTVAGGEIGDDVFEGVFFNEWVDITNLRVPDVYVAAASWYYRVKAWVLGH